MKIINSYQGFTGFDLALLINDRGAKMILNGTTVTLSLMRLEDTKPVQALSLYGSTFIKIDSESFETPIYVAVWVPIKMVIDYDGFTGFDLASLYSKNGRDVLINDKKMILTPYKLVQNNSRVECDVIDADVFGVKETDISPETLVDMCLL